MPSRLTIPTAVKHACAKEDGRCALGGGAYRLAGVRATINGDRAGVAATDGRIAGIVMLDTGTGDDTDVFVRTAAFQRGKQTAIEITKDHVGSQDGLGTTIPVEDTRSCPPVLDAVPHPDTEWGIELTLDIGLLYNLARAIGMAPGNESSPGTVLTLCIPKPIGVCGDEKYVREACLAIGRTGAVGAIMPITHLEDAKVRANRTLDEYGKLIKRRRPPKGGKKKKTKKKTPKQVVKEQAKKPSSRDQRQLDLCVSKMESACAKLTLAKRLGAVVDIAAALLLCLVISGCDAPPEGYRPNTTSNDYLRYYRPQPTAPERR